MTDQVKGKTFMFTGRLSVTRSQAQGWVTELGGTAGHSITRVTDYLIAGEDCGQKLQKAKSLGIDTLTEEEFSNLLTEARKHSIPVKEQVLERPKPVEMIPPHRETLSYGNEQVLLQFLSDHPEVSNLSFRLGPKECSHCEAPIPYTISTTSWYCFQCRLATWDIELPEVISPLHERKSARRHYCQPKWMILLRDAELATIKKCRKCGRVILYDKSELDDFYRDHSNSDYVHSVEFVVGVADKYDRIDKTDRGLSSTVTKGGTDGDYEAFSRRMAKLESQAPVR